MVRVRTSLMALFFGSHNIWPGILEKVDLHYLWVEEAKRIVQALFDHHKGMLLYFYPVHLESVSHCIDIDTGKMHRLTLVTGRGIHSERGQARLRPAMEALARAHGYRITALRDGELDLCWP